MNQAIALRLPWFRVHIVILNDPGRLISVHLMHTGILCSWSGLITLYELILLDATDPTYNPIWRQGCYVLPFITRIGCSSSVFGWSLGIELASTSWTYETVSGSHIILAGALILASFWHWAYFDLDIFVCALTNQLVLDLNRVFSIHFNLASFLCFGFGYGHLTGSFGPGMWASDSKGLLGSVRYIKPTYGILSAASFCYSLIPSHHILAGSLSSIVSIWHLKATPGPTIYRINNMSNIESVLSTSIVSVFFASIISSSTMWYGSVSSPIELLGPTRYHWDNGYFSQDLERRVLSVDRMLLDRSWEQVPDKLVLYDYIGCNPSKSGIFRAGSMLKGDGVVQNWIGHSNFEMGTLSLSVVRCPAFFETFPVILVDSAGTIRADVPFRRASSSNSIEQKYPTITLYWSGGILDGLGYNTTSVLKNYARKAEFGEIFTFDVESTQADGVFRTSARGWYSFSHLVLAFLFFFGHLWHASRAIFRSNWTGVNISSIATSEYGLFEKLADRSSSSSISV